MPENTLFIPKKNRITENFREKTKLFLPNHKY